MKSFVGLGSVFKTIDSVNKETWDKPLISFYGLLEVSTNKLISGVFRFYFGSDTSMNYYLTQKKITCLKAKNN